MKFTNAAVLSFLATSMVEASSSDTAQLRNRARKLQKAGPVKKAKGAKKNPPPPGPPPGSGPCAQFSPDPDTQYLCQLLTESNEDGTPMGGMTTFEEACSAGVFGSPDNPKLPPTACDDFASLGIENGGQTGANVTAGYQGSLNVDVVPITKPLRDQISPATNTALCPVNVHWHIGAEHLSAGEYDKPFGTSGPTFDAPDVGLQCNKYDPTNPIFTTPFDFKFCKDMQVGQTYEVHWPHSSTGACGTEWQYQTPFLQGIFCNLDTITTAGLLATGQAGRQAVADTVGVEAQVFIIVNDEVNPAGETNYYPNLFDGMIRDGAIGQDIAYYTGSTTGPSYNDMTCSPYTPVTWQVDRRCNMISASSFDKMCATMLSQRSDMVDDTSPNGSRKAPVADDIAADNQVRRDEAEEEDDEEEQI